ncbi:MAG: 2-octaprenyl-6-methoxyphenol hydroxylase [Burkholderiaceae bacterium]|nr:2-octaprenyl-6-methoxyphenol hydroxylase [Burkholderiaceae bacterium]
MTSTSNPLRLAVVGAGPAGLALALLAAQRLPHAQVSVFDARTADKDVSLDPRTLALSLGSVQLLQRLHAWPREAAQPIGQVHVSQAPPGFDAAVTIRAADEAVPMLGAVLSYGALTARLQQVWLERCALEPARLSLRLGTPVSALKEAAGEVEVDAGIAERFDLAVVAEGGVFSDQARKALSHDYRQVAWVGEVGLEGGAAGLAVERFTANGPLALLPLPAAHEVPGSRAALVWCVPQADDAVAPLDDAQRLVLLNSQLPAIAGRAVRLGALKRFTLGLNAERTLVRGRTVRIGNAAQTLHPVAGQGLNLGLRDAYALVDSLRNPAPIDAALRRIEWSRAPDRWSTIATTDFLARSFTWRWPGLSLLRGAALVALDAAAPVKSRLARQMMFGWR